MSALLAFLLVFVQDSDAERLRKLEETVKKQQSEIDELKKKQDSPAAAAPFTASLQDGLRFRTADGNVDLHAGGRFQEHWRVILDRPDGAAPAAANQRTTPDTFLIRAARLQIDGTFYKDYGFVVESDFPSQSAVSGTATPTLQKAYVEWKRWAEFSLRFGQFKAPQSQEELCSLLFTEFNERSILSRFVPSYDIGLQAQGRLFENVVAYQAAITNGRSHLENAGRLRNDDNDEKEYLGRVTVSPFVTDKDSVFAGLRLGIYGSSTDVDNVAMSPAATSNAFDIVTPELGVLMLDPTGGLLDGHRRRLGTEFSYSIGPVGLRSEYLWRRDGMVNVPRTVDTDVRTQAWYAAVSWILTGEDKLFENRIMPAGDWGAVEVAFRVAGCKIGDNISQVFTPATLAGQSTRLTSYTFGINWWVTRQLRVSFDAISEDYHTDIAFGNGVNKDNLYGFLTRFQIDF
ncbi:MAG TPA: porin [Planctomycetota bacterium]|nr:porin [Planctomycetota bacterium]